MNLIWLLFVLFAHTSFAQTIKQLSPDYLSLYEQIGDNPESVRQQLDSSLDLDQLNSTDRAQLFYLKAQLASALDISNDMIKYSRQGMAVIDINQQPWLFHKLKLTELDGLNRQGLGASGLTAGRAVLTWAQKNQHLQLQLEALIVLGELRIATAEYKQAIDHLQTAYNQAPDTGHGVLKAHVAGHLAGIYITRGEFEIAIPYITESLKHNRQLNKSLSTSIDLFELGRANMIIGNVELGKQQLQESIDISRELRDLQGIAYPTQELAYYELSEGNIDVAEALATQAHQLFVDADNKIMQFDSYMLYTDIFINKKDFTQAAAALAAATQLIDPDLMPYEVLRIKHYQANLTAAQGDYKTAYSALSETIYEKETIDAKQSAEKLHQLRSRYEIDAKEAENQLLGKTNELQEMEINNRNEQFLYLAILTSISTAFLLLFMFFAFKYKKQSKKLHDLANYDGLTGLRNRANTLYTIKKLFATREQSKAITLVMIDLDHFKKINDLFGHALGDKVLKLFGEHCRELLVSKGDIMGRIGGEEFLLCLPGRLADEAMQVTEQLRKISSAIPDHISVADLRVSLSAGIACTDGEESFKQLLKRADDAMYEAKANGRNQIIVDDRSFNA